MDCESRDNGRGKFPAQVILASRGRPKQCDRSAPLSLRRDDAGKTVRRGLVETDDSARTNCPSNFVMASFRAAATKE